MTQNSFRYIVVLLWALALLGKFYGTIGTLQEEPDSNEMHCNVSDYYLKEEITCGVNSTILVEATKDNVNHVQSNVQFNCYNTTPLNISLPPEINFAVGTVKFNSCRFSAHENILKMFKNPIQVLEINTIAFDNELILSRANLEPLDGLVKELSFNIKNLSTLPIDLFEDIKTLNKLSIYSDSIDSSHLSSLLAPLKDLSKMVLEIPNLQELSGSIFAHTKNLTTLIIRYLYGNNFTSLPNDLFLETRKLQSFSLIGNKAKLEQLPKGLLRDLPVLKEVIISGCKLKSISGDIFNGSLNVQFIKITGHNFQELPLRLFSNQAELWRLNLSGNMIQKLIEGLFDYNTKLEYLNLSDNQLTNLPKNIFKPLTKLNQLLLDNNKLLTMSLDYNQPQLGSVFDNLEKLRSLSLINNSINEISYSIFNNKEDLNSIDLSFNNISSINCTFLTSFDSIINLANNSINCSSNIICLHQYIVQKPMQMNHELGKINCKFPSALDGQLLYKLKLGELLSFPDIHRQSNISNRCTFNIRTPDSVLVMNCSNGNFIDIPMLPMSHKLFSNGIELIMDNNPLSELSTKILEQNTKSMTLFSISNSPITELPKGFLSKLKKLKTVSLVLPLMNISEDIFLESTALQTIKISGANIKSLPEQIFASQDKLIELDLSGNRLETFNWSGLRCNQNLEILNLSHNFINYLNDWFPGGLPKLKKLFLDDNKLKNLDLHFINFHSLPSLECLNLGNNELTNMKSIGTFPETLQTLILWNNSINDVSSLGLHGFLPGLIDLSSNKMDWIDFSYLSSINPNRTVFNFTDNDIRTFKIKYGNVSFYCDCHSFVKAKKLTNLYESLRCLSPNNLIDGHISNFPQEESLCPVLSICPTGCRCWFRLGNSTLIVNCSNASLTEAPSLLELETTFQDGIELFIEHNQLTSLRPPHSSQSRYKIVNKIFAAHNSITKLTTEDIPENIFFLDISYNQLERLDNKTIQVIQKSRNLRTLLIHNNSIACDCSSENLIHFIMGNKQLFPHTDRCGDGRKFLALSFSEMCSVEPSNTAKLIWIPLLGILCLVLLLTVFYLKKREIILIWLYAHNINLCCVTEEEIDKDKKYDAFISYSSLDEDFVALNLLPKLESGPKPYKLCLHERDWLGGGYIPYQIEKSVESSRRTLIVMSQNYINSQWTRLEFRTAHNASLNEKRPRVIVIMIDDKVDIKDLDSDLQKYIKMYTYLRWGDAWFWDRLRYVLPHPSKKNKDIKRYEEKMCEGGGDADAGMSYSLDENKLF